MLDTMATRSYCGFLERRMGWLQGWRLGWYELDCELCTLTMYEHETANKPSACFTLTEMLLVEAVQDVTRSFVFKLTIPDVKGSFLFAAPNMAIIEAWMLLLIQIQMGAIKPEENFRTGESQEAVVSSLSCPLTYNGAISANDVNYFVEIQEQKIVQEIPRLCCGVQKRSIHKRQWKSRYIVLKDHMVTLYASEEDADNDTKPRGSRSFHSTSRLALLPKGFEGQEHGLAFITANPPYADCVSLRISFSDDETLQKWYDTLRMEIMRSVWQKNQSELGDNTPISRDLSTESHHDFQNNLRPSVFRFKSSRSIEEYTKDYITNFVFYEPGSKYSQVVVFENQRYVPLVGWSGSNLLFTDCARYTNGMGEKYPEPSLELASPPPTYKWIREESDTSESSLRKKSLSVPHALGLLGFEIDMNYTSTDPNGGWTYGISFKRIQAHMSENSSHYFAKKGDFVRRRRWIRLADLKFDREM